MLSIDYSTIFSRFFSQVEGNECAEMEKNYITAMLDEWLHSSVAQMSFRKLFSSISLDDETQMVDFEMKRSVDEDSDKEFVIDVLAMGLGIKWLKPKMVSTKNVRQMMGSKEEKWYSQKEHLSELRNLYESLQKEQQSAISERNTYYNSYMDKKKGR